VEGEECGSTRAAQSRAALRISKQLFVGRKGKGHLGGVQSAPFFGHREEPLWNLKLPGEDENAD
jgi:hypothetical protein